MLFGGQMRCIEFCCFLVMKLDFVIFDEFVIGLDI